MIIKKKLKNTRGRPRKEFKPKHKRLKEQAQTATGIVEHKLPKNESLLRMPSKDKSIFYLFIFSIILFLLALSISFFKKDLGPVKGKAQQLQGTQEETARIIVETEAETKKVEEQAEIGSVTEMVENMYGVINSKSFDELSNYWDASLINSNTIKTYFTARRLTRFLNNIKDGTIAISDIQQEQIKDYSRKVTYKLGYTLLNEQPFEEEWNVTVIRKNNEYSIATIKCETTGCSRMPFFNPGKYNIK